MLDALHDTLETIYQTDCGEQFSDYLVTSREVANCLSSMPLAASVEETVLVAQDEHGLAVSVFLDEALLGRLAVHNPIDDLQPAALADLSLVLEGVSHFNYIACCAQEGREVTKLELELQAEVDKYVATTLLALQQNDVALTRLLHRHLFSNVAYHESLSEEERARYKTANDYAARFCHRLRERLGSERALQELRHFYRLTQAQKISHIHTTAWHGPKH